MTHCVPVLFLTRIIFTYFPLFKIFLIEHCVYLVRQSRMIERAFIFL